MWTLAIDFGTSNTAAAMFVDGKAESLEVEGERRMPSVVLVDDSGTIVVGHEARNQAALFPDRVQRAVKRKVGRSESLLFGDDDIAITTVIAALLKPFAAEGLRQRNGEAPAAVVLTHPARWNEERLAVLRAAADEAGLSEVMLCPEPVAAAVHYVDEHIDVGHCVAVYDLGGGTFDTAVLQRTPSSFEVKGLPGGDEFIGGEYFDDRLFGHFGSLISREDHELWENIETSDDRKWREANVTLREQCRKAKESLSSNPTAYVRVADRDLLITRDEFEDLIAQDIERTIAELDRTLQIANVPKEYIGRLYLAGGAGRIPLVHHGLTKSYADRLVTWADPKFVVALGAARYGAENHTPAAPAGPPPPTGAPVSTQPPPTGAPVSTHPGPPVGPPASVQPGPPPGPPPPPGAIAAGAAVPPPAPGQPVTGPTPPGAPPQHQMPQQQAPQYQAPQQPLPQQQAPQYQAPQPAQQYGAAPAATGEPGKDKMMYAWICAGVGLLCCFLVCGAGIYFASEAKKEGHPQAQTAMIANIAVGVLALIVQGFLTLAVLASGSTTTGY